MKPIAQLDKIMLQMIILSIQSTNSWVQFCHLPPLYCMGAPVEGMEANSISF